MLSNSVKLKVKVTEVYKKCIKIWLSRVVRLVSHLLASRHFTSQEGLFGIGVTAQVCR